MIHSPTDGARRTRQAGFSLMELAVVVIMLAVMTSAVTPLFRTTLVRLRTEQGIQDLLTTMQYAQERAVSDGREYRIYLHARENTYWLERFVEVDDWDQKVYEKFERADVRALPEELNFRRVSAKTDRVTRANYITCYPSGACDEATVRVERANGRGLTIETKGRLGSFRVRDRER